MLSSFRIAGLTLAILALGACGDKPAPITPPPAAATADSGDDTATAGKLAVVNFSPNTTPAGTSFNVQADGNSGISFELNRPAPAAEFAGWFDNKPLTGLVANKMIVTATIPGEYLAQPGSYPIELEVGGVRLPAGTFVVAPR